MADEVRLPVDLLHLLSNQLALRLDFATLYSCVASSKLFAEAGAAAALYRISHLSPVKGGGSESLPPAEQTLNLQRWSILWRTTILSAFGGTLHPYCRHLRMLDLSDFAELLNTEQFRGQISKQFFSDELARFHFTIEVKWASRAKTTRLDRSRIVFDVGNELTQHAPLIESISEPSTMDTLSTALLTWAPRLSHLRRLTLFDGRALEDDTLRNLLHVHCPNLDTLTIFRSSGSNTGHALATFLTGMPANKLIHFENYGDFGLDAETFLALCTHSASLKTLKLELSDEDILALGALAECTALQNLAISTDRVSPDLKATQNDVFLQIVEWLRNCSSLTSLSLKNMVSAPDLITPVLLNSAVRLEKLAINANREDALYNVREHHDFNKALSKQTSLQELHLHADPEELTLDDIEILMDTFCSLTELRDLKLLYISNYFTNEHLATLAKHLPHLEELYIGGYGISDAVLSGISTLKQLKTLTFNGITSFSSDAIKAYIDQLDSAGNKGLALSVDNADPVASMSQEEQDELGDLIRAKVEGRFDYVLLRDPNVPEFDSDDSD